MQQRKGNYFFSPGIVLSINDMMSVQLYFTSPHWCQTERVTRAAATRSVTLATILSWWCTMTLERSTNWEPLRYVRIQMHCWLEPVGRSWNSVSCLFSFSQGQFNFVEVIIKPLDYECNLVTLQCRKGELISVFPQVLFHNTRFVLSKLKFPLLLSCSQIWRG